MHLNAFNVLCFTISDNEKFVFCLGTWQTYIVKDQDVWHKINKDSPMEYAATITVNPLTALKMLEDFVTLNSGTVFLILVLYSFTGLTLTSLV
jgi:NADPH:quinone reductase-like Zn-dependent oxidoreductase